MNHAFFPLLQDRASCCPESQGGHWLRCREILIKLLLSHQPCGGADHTHKSDLLIGFHMKAIQMLQTNEITNSPLPGVVMSQSYRAFLLLAVSVDFTALCKWKARPDDSAKFELGSLGEERLSHSCTTGNENGDMVSVNGLENISCIFQGSGPSYETSVEASISQVGRNDI